MENKIQLHDTVIVKNIDWCGNGTAEYPLHKCNAVGEVTSIRELSLGHSNKHTYEVTWRGGRYYTDNLNGELTKKQSN